MQTKALSSAADEGAQANEALGCRTCTYAEQKLIALFRSYTLESGLSDLFF